MSRFNILQPKDKVVPFFKKCLYLVASKLSLEVVPFCKSQANSGGLSTTMFFFCFLFFLAFSLGLGIYLCLGYMSSSCCVQLGGNFFFAAAFLSVTFCMFRIPFSNYCQVKLLLNCWLLLRWSSMQKVKF